MKKLSNTEAELKKYVRCLQKKRVYRYLFNFQLCFMELFFGDFNGGSSRKEDLQMLVLKPEEKMMENVRGSDQF